MRLVGLLCVDGRILHYELQGFARLHFFAKPQKFFLKVISFMRSVTACICAVRLVDVPLGG